MPFCQFEKSVNFNCHMVDKDDSCRLDFGFSVPKFRTNLVRVEIFSAEENDVEHLFDRCGIG